MANGFRYQESRRLAISGAIATVEEAGTLMKISGDYAFAKADANALVIGELVKKPSVAGEVQAVATNLSDVMTIKAAATITAGQMVKLAAPDGGGVQQVTPWVDGIDSVLRQFGIAIKGAAANAEADILTLR